MPPVTRQRTAAPARPSETEIDGISASVWGEANGFRGIIYGRSATGKTTLASTFPGPMLWLVCSGGSRPGELKSIDTPENRRKITPRVIRSSDQMRGFIEEARNYETTVIDHTTGFLDLLLKEILGLSELPAQKSWGMARQEQYGQQASQAKEYCRALLNLPGNVLFLAQERVFGGKDEGMDPSIVKPTVGPALTPSVATFLCPAVDYLVHTFIKPRTTKVTNEIAGQVITTEVTLPNEYDYCLRTGTSDYFMVKFRKPRSVHLVPYITDPDYDKIQAVIRGEHEEE